MPFESLGKRRRKYCSMECYDSARREKATQRLSSPLKRCGKCDQSKPHSAFYTTTSTRHLDGLAGWCKACRCADERRRRADPALWGKFHQKYETDMDFRARELLRAIGKRCRKHGWEFDLDRDWLAVRLKAGCCEITGLPFDYSVAGRKRNAYTPSIDRIRAGGGYTKDNCRVVIFALNLAMSDWGIQVIEHIAEALVAKKVCLQVPA